MELGLSQKTILVLLTFTKQFKEILIVEKVGNGALIFILIYQVDNTF